MSPIIRPIESKHVWEDFISTCKPNTFLQSWQWGGFHERTGHAVRRLGVYDAERLVACALIILIKARRGSFLFCPHGPIVRVGADVPAILNALVPSLRKAAREAGCHFVRISPLLARSDEHWRVFRDLGFRSAPIHMHPELAWILDVTPPEDELLKNMRKTTRYSIRKAEADGVNVRISRDPADVETFWTVYRATVDRHHFTPFSKDYLRREFESFAADDRAAWFFASYQGDVIAAAMVIYDRRSGYYHQGASIQKYSKITASHLLQWRAIQEAKKRGCSFYNFWGVAPENRPRHPWAGLSLFKKGFGGFAEEYVHAQDLVMSPKYWFTWGVETARRMRRGL